MKRLLAALFLPLVMHAADDGFSPMFNGRDLSGWVPLGIGENTFSVKDGLIVSTGAPVGMLRTERMYENFEMELEWRHMKSGGNAGVFVWGDGFPAVGSPFPRGIEVQVLDLGYNAKGKNEWYSTHGDVFAVGGAKMTPAGRISPNGRRSFPAEERTKPSPEWNHYRIVAQDGEIRLSVNGQEVTYARGVSPRKGYLMLESEGSEAHFRNVRIKELPSTNPRPDEIARDTTGYLPLFNGLDFSGWRVPEGDGGHWKIVDEAIDYDALSEAKGDKHLWTERKFTDYSLIVDWRMKETPYVNPRARQVLPDGSDAAGPDGKPLGLNIPDTDSGIILGGDQRFQINIWCWPIGSGEMYGLRTDKTSSPELRAAVTPRMKADAPIGKWNRYEITHRKGAVTVVLNGQTVIPTVNIPGLPSPAAIGLQHHGAQKDGVWTSPPALMQFRNIFIKELKD